MWGSETDKFSFSEESLIHFDYMLFLTFNPSLLHLPIFYPHLLLLYPILGCKKRLSMDRAMLLGVQIIALLFR